MVKSTQRHFRLEPGEYIITPDHPDARDYKVLFKGKDVGRTTTAIVRINIEALKKRQKSKN